VTRFLNRQAQQYLTSTDGSAPVISVPDGNTDDWRLEKGRPGDTYHLAESTPPHRRLVPAGNGVVLEATKPGLRPPGAWRLSAVGDRSGYQHLVGATEPLHGLQLSSSGAAGGDALPVAYGPIGPRDPAAMWLLAESLVADARSIHLRYPTAEDTSEFHNSIMPHDTPPGTYFCVAGFGANSRGPGPSGYAGIQSRGDGSRIAIFSLWHRMKDEVTPDDRALAAVVDAHPDADRTAFGGEGSGVSIRIPFSWPDDTPIRFALRSKAEGNNTLVAAYVGIGMDRWIKLGTLARIATGGRLLTGFYSFVEDFLRNGATPGVPAGERSPYRRRRALFHNPWVGDSAGLLHPVQTAAVTAYGPHPLENLSVDAVEGNFGLIVSTGGTFASLPTVVGVSFSDPAPDTRTPPPPL